MDRICMKTWKEARDNCTGQQPSTPISVAANELFWIGLRKSQWKWTNGSDIELKQSQGSNATETQNCIFLNKDNHVLGCNETIIFFFNKDGASEEDLLKWIRIGIAAMTIAFLFLLIIIALVVIIVKRNTRNQSRDLPRPIPSLQESTHDRRNYTEANPVPSPSHNGEPSSLTKVNSPSHRLPATTVVYEIGPSKSLKSGQDYVNINSINSPDSINSPGSINSTAEAETPRDKVVLSRRRTLLGIAEKEQYHLDDEEYLTPYCLNINTSQKAEVSNEVRSGGRSHKKPQTLPPGIPNVVKKPLENMDLAAQERGATLKRLGFVGGKIDQLKQRVMANLDA